MSLAEIIEGLHRLTGHFTGRLLLSEPEINYIIGNIKNKTLLPADEDESRKVTRPLKKRKEKNSTAHQYLALYHDCRSTGCTDLSCPLCESNSLRPCTRNVKSKYIMGDELKASCRAPIYVRLVDELGNLVEDVDDSYDIEIVVLNGAMCNALLKTKEFLSPKDVESSRVHLDSPRVYAKLVKGQVDISFVKFMQSSEATLGGKAPTFTLLFRAVDEEKKPSSGILYSLSEPFVVTTPRTRSSLKSDIPRVSDPVSGIPKVGKQTAKKLADVNAALKNAGFAEITVPEHMNNVNDARGFGNLAILCDDDPRLKRTIIQVFKFSEADWMEASAHALSATEPDVRPRMWFDPTTALGLLYGCKDGVIDVNPVQVVKLSQGCIHRMELAGLDPLQLSQIKTMHTAAADDWFREGHPGWSIYSDLF